MSHFNSPKPKKARIPNDKKIIEVCKSLKILMKEYQTHKKSQISKKQKMKILMRKADDSTLLIKGTRTVLFLFFTPFYYFYYLDYQLSVRNAF
jgi:hypothetical protein